MKSLMSFLCLVFIFRMGYGGEKESHSVTSSVQPISVLGITGEGHNNGNHTVLVSIAGVTVTNTELKWTANVENQKITIKSNLTNPNHVLKVSAKNVHGGTSAGKVTVSSLDTDFITGISKTLGHCNLEYRAVVDRNKSEADVHTIYYTIVSN